MGGGGGGAPPAPTPTPVPDSRYGVILHTRDTSKHSYFLNTVGAQWYLDFGRDVSVVPSGHRKVISVMSLTGPSAAEIASIAQASPGAVWYLMGEANRRWSVSQVVTPAHDLYTAIKAADPTARVTTPSMLNWDFTCNGCGGYTSGHSWMEAFRSSYETQYGTMPFEIWAIDVYPIDWLNLPTVNSQIAIDQLTGMRAYLDSFQTYQGKPIWIMEISLHWGWTGMDFSVSGCGGLPTPAGTYQTQQVIGYLQTVYNWLETNSGPMNIERWFQFNTYRDITACSSDTYAGLTLFTGPEPGADLSTVGAFYRNRVFG